MGWLVTEMTVTVRKGNTLCSLHNSVCLQVFPLLGSWWKRAHVSFSLAGIYQQTKAVCWNEKKSLVANVLGQSTSNCLNCFTKHLVTTFNSQETFSVRWCLWVILFSIYLLVPLPANEVIDLGGEGKVSECFHFSSAFHYLNSRCNLCPLPLHRYCTPYLFNKLLTEFLLFFCIKRKA